MFGMKIVILYDDKQIVYYDDNQSDAPSVTSSVFRRLNKESNFGGSTVSGYSMYWIDDDGDKITINESNKNDYNLFQNFFKSKDQSPKIYFAIDTTTKASESRKQQPQSSTGSPQQEHQAVHTTVTCDGCGVKPVRGYRYKCLNCPDYDLCMRCEADMKHPDHPMIRIPNTERVTWESLGPYISIFATKRRQKKFAAAAAAAAKASTSGQEDGKSRHHRHHRRHCSAPLTGNMGTGFLSDFYKIMQSMAEGGAAATDTPTAPNTETSPATERREQQQEATPPTQAPTAQAATPPSGRQSKETNTSPPSSTTTVPEPAATGSAATGSTATGESIPTAPSFEDIQKLIDPSLMKAGIQILNSFGELFGKILDPVVTVDASRSGTSSPEVVIDIDLTGNNGQAKTTPPTSPETPKQATTANAASGEETPMETELLAPSPVYSDESGDWAMVDEVATSTTTPVEPTVVGGPATPSSGPSTSAPTPATAAIPLDYAKLSEQLRSHLIEAEAKEQSQPAVSTSAPAPTVPTAPNPTPAPAAEPITVVTSTPASAPTSLPFPSRPPPLAAIPTERRAMAVFHPNPRINKAVHNMMAMGFSNEGAALTQLLESVNGDIAVAVDIMTAAQGN